MIVQNLVLLTAVFGVTALIMLGGAVLLTRRTAAARAGLRRASVVLDERAALLPVMLSAARAGLAQRGAAIENGLQKVARFDDRLAAATSALAERRLALDALRERLQSARAGIERMKAAAGMIMRAIELRRAILG